jgi:hypothetical protein
LVCGGLEILFKGEKGDILKEERGFSPNLSTQLKAFSIDTSF